MHRFDRLPAPAFRRATRAESAKLGEPYSAKRYLPTKIKRVTANTRTISERQYRTKREGVSVETAIAERKRGVRSYPRLPPIFGRSARSSEIGAILSERTSGKRERVVTASANANS